MSRLSCTRAGLVVLAIVASAASAAAQAPAVLDPRVAEFDPSVDHNAIGSNGQPVVTRYDLELFVLGGTQPVQVANLGKPAPQGDGKIRVDFTTLLNPWPAPGTTYEARIAAVGPTGTGRSTQSNTFAFSSPCSSSISPTSISVGGAASTGSVAVTAVPGCAWGATSAASWLTITSGAAGSGNGTVAYSVATNASTSQRSGTMTIAGHTFTVTQSAGCTYSITPSATSVTAAGTTGSVSVTTLSSCAWTASSSASWISVTSGGSGTGSGTVGYSVAAYTGSSTRTGTVTIAGRTFTVTQDPPVCNYVISPVSATLGAAAATGSVGVTATGGCAWTASSSASWITITGGSSGTGNGQVNYSVAANPGTTSRSGTLTVGGQAFTVTQSGQTCTFSISPVSASVPAAATTSSVSVSTLQGCAWTATASVGWVSITSGASGTGNGTVAFSVAANTGLSSRTGTVTVGGQTFTVDQAGVVCSATISPVGASVGASGAQGTVGVTLPAACAWTASSSASWVSITSGGSGTGSGSVGYTVAANTSTSSRTATLTIAGQTFSVSQAGITCSYTVAPTAAPAVSSAGTGSVTVTAAAGCAWTASSAVSWMTITGGASGSGNGTVSYSFLANPTTQPRAGVLTVASQAVTVTQAAGCGYTISPASASLTASAGSGTVNITAGAACSWTAQSVDPWVTFATATTGTGNGSVGYVVAANTTSASRSATITVAGQPFVITQGGAACDATLTPTTQNIGAAGGNGSVGITLPGGCGWSAVPSASWLSILTGSSGVGTGTVTYSVQPNPNGTSRSGTIAIGGRLLTVTQAPAACTPTLSSTHESVEAVGGSRVLSVVIPPGCVWTSISTTPWITVTSGNGPNTTGNAAVTFLVAANASTSPRTGTLTVSGRTVTVDQAGTCAITISPDAVSAGSDAGTGSVDVSTGGACAWSATTTASWVTITGGTSGVGNGTVLYSTAANTVNTSRTATITIGGRVFTVTQAAPACSAVLSTTSVAVTSAPAFRTVQVTVASTCGWTATSSVPWITIVTGASGTGSASVSYNVAANSSTASRTGTVTIAGQTMAVAQAGVPCTTDLAPTSITLDGAGTNAAVTVLTSAGCGWTASSNVSWLTVTSGSSGTGTGSVQYAVAPNPSALTRLGTLTIGGRSFFVSQTGNSCTSALSSSGVSVGPAASSVSVDVSAAASCTWAASSNTAWITVVSGASGSGPGTVGLAIADNPGALVRSGTVAIAGKTFMVTQSGACDPSVSPTGVTVGSGNSISGVWVTAGVGCAWSAQSPVSWITLNTSGGQGGGVVNLTIAANPNTTPRSATLTIGDNAVLVTQAAAACNYSVTPVSMSVAGGTHPVSITAPAGCTWTASSTASWITFPNGGSGSGSATLNVQFAPNSMGFSRIAFLDVAGWRLFVTQRVSSPPNPPTGLVVR